MPQNVTWNPEVCFSRTKTLNIIWNPAVWFFKTKIVREISNHGIFPFKPVALSGKENQVSYANTRLPTEYGDEDDPGEIATITRQRGITSLVQTSSFHHECYQ